MENSGKTCAECIHILVCGHNLSVKDAVRKGVFKKELLGGKGQDKSKEVIVGIMNSIFDSSLHMKDFRNALLNVVDIIIASICDEYKKE